jgi:hypothetical protein
VPGFFCGLVWADWYSAVDLYLVQIGFSVPGTKGARCTRYKKGAVYQVQKKINVPKLVNH